jgi:hypothetical protein
MKSLVTIKFNSGRTRNAVGIETVGRGHSRVLCHQIQIPIEFRHATGRMAHSAAHHGDQEPAARQRVEVVRYG